MAKHRWDTDDTQNRYGIGAPASRENSRAAQRNHGAIYSTKVIPGCDWLCLASRTCSCAAGRPFTREPVPTEMALVPYDSPVACACLEGLLPNRLSCRMCGSDIESLATT